MAANEGRNTVSHTQVERLAAQILAHDREISEMRADISALGTNTKHIADGQKLLAQKFDDIAHAISSRGRASVSEVASYLQVIALLFAIVGATVSGIVYVAGNANSSRLDLLHYKVDRLYGSFGWEPAIRRDDGKPR